MKKSHQGLLGAGLFLLASLALGFAGASLAADQNDNDISLVNPGTLTVCTHLPYKPLEFINKDREVVGFDVDLANLVAAKLGVETSVLSIGWNQITSGTVFVAGKCDLAMGGATITEKRKEAVLFSDPYFDANQALLAKADSGIEGLADLKGKRLAVETATTGKIYAEKHADEYGYSMVVYADTALQATAVSAGTVEAAIEDSAPMYEYASEHPETAVVAVIDTGERYGFMAKKDDANAARLIDLFNTALAEARADGTYAKLYKKWFGVLPEVAQEQQ